MSSGQKRERDKQVKTTQCKFQSVELVQALLANKFCVYLSFRTKKFNKIKILMVQVLFITQN